MIRKVPEQVPGLGALLSLTRAQALELAPDGIRMNCVLPGAIDTPMLREGLMRGHLDSDRVDIALEELGRRHVMERVGRPHEVGEVILFLADPSHSSFITGQAVVVDGGATTRLSTEEAC